MSDTPAPRLRFWLDYVDPASWLLLQLLMELGEDLAEVAFEGVEIAVPPQEMVDPRSEGWSAYCDDVDRLAAEAGLEPISRPARVPWSRKAHELARHAREKNAGPGVHEALFRAHFDEGRDLGRVDVLAEIAIGLGLDWTESKAVLDVDKYTDEVSDARDTALEAGLQRIPTLLTGDGRSLVGPAGMGDLRSLLKYRG